MAWSPATARFKPWVRLVQVVVILAVGGVLLASGISGYRAGQVRGTPVVIPDEQRRIAAAEQRLAGNEDEGRARAAEEIREARARIFQEERRQAALAARGRSIGLIAVGSLGYAVLIFEFVRILVLMRRRSTQAGS